MVFMYDDQPPVPFEQVCDYAEGAAAQALATLERSS